MVERGRAHEDAGFRSREAGGPDARIFQGFPGQFEQQALLRVHLLGFARRHAERPGIEAPNIVEHAGGEGVGASAFCDARMQ